MQSSAVPQCQSESNQPASPLVSWGLCVAPFVVYALVTSLEPGPPEAARGHAGATGWFSLGLPYSAYPLMYSVKIALTVACVLAASKGWRQFLPFRLTRWSLVVGCLGAAAWIGLAELQHGLQWTGQLGERPGFNPLDQIADPAWRYGFFAVRTFGLIAIVPIVEELFLRGFVVRYVLDADWPRVAFGRASRLGLALATILPMAYHPNEALAAAVWFSAVSRLMLRTRSLWDCIFAHAITNLCLGIYVLQSGHWYLL